MDTTSLRQALHDLNSTLQIATGNIELLEMSGPLNEECQEYVTVALKALEHAAAQVRVLQRDARVVVPGATHPG